MAYCLLNLNGKGILAEGDICASQRRASSESLGYLARFGNDIFTARMACSFNLVFKIHVLLLCLVVFNYKKPSLPYTGSILSSLCSKDFFLYFHVFCHGGELSYYRGCVAKL